MMNFNEFMDAEYPNRNHPNHAVYTEADMRKAYDTALGIRKKKELFDEGRPERNGLTANQRFRIANGVKPIMGSASGILSAQTNGIGLPKIREVLSDIYLKTDKLVQLVDEIEEEVKVKNGKTR